MNDIKKTEGAAISITNPDVDFKGYTLEEIRYRRALLLMQKEFCKTKITRNIHNLRNSNPLSASSAASSMPGKMGFMATKLLKGLNYLDYAMLGFTILSSARKVYSFFHKKKK